MIKDQNWALVEKDSIRRMEKVCIANERPYFTDGSLPYDQANYSIREVEDQGEMKWVLNIEDALQHMDENNLESQINEEFEVELGGATVRQWLQMATIKRSEII